MLKYPFNNILCGETLEENICKIILDTAPLAVSVLIKETTIIGKIAEGEKRGMVVLFSNPPSVSRVTCFFLKNYQPPIRVWIL